MPDALPTAVAVEPHPWFLERIPEDFARRHLLLGARSIGSDDTIELLHAPTTPVGAVWNTTVALSGAEKSSFAAPVVRVVVETDAETLAHQIDSAYRPDPEAVGVVIEPDALPAELDSADLLATAGKAEVVKLIDLLILEASRRSASDLHFQPTDNCLLVRLRIDGVLQTLRELPVDAASAVTSRIKVMGHMDIAERRLPQDGRASARVGGDRSIDLRISTLPTNFGERVVIRLLEDGSRTALTDLASLGMPSDVEAAYKERAGRNNGIILLTGPTGSGKTTTLYATLRWIAEGAHGESNIMTVEDPIEYNLATGGLAISQSQVNTKKGVTFASGLRHILRQDPDVVMVGEVRDAETARIAIQASLTGHLVFSTLHTNDSAGAIARLVDLGIEPYLVSASLSAVLAQRLVRTVHHTCAGEGCEACFGSGLMGRTGLYELLSVSEPIREIIASGATTSAVRQAARSGGMRLLAEEGDQLVAGGRTTPDEIARSAAGGVG
ncbi:MAG: GspE/PulE family protein [Planctomycetota bacterium]